MRRGPDEEEGSRKEAASAVPQERGVILSAYRMWAAAQDAQDRTAWRPGVPFVYTFRASLTRDLFRSAECGVTIRNPK